MIAGKTGQLFSDCSLPAFRSVTRAANGSLIPQHEHCACSWGGPGAEKVFEFFSDADRQRRMEESELHHDRSPLTGVVRELESQPGIDRFLADAHIRRNTRFRQAIGVLVRMIMERRGWKKTGRKGSLGVRAVGAVQTPAHNTGGLAFWFVRAERYERADGMPFRSVRQRCEELESTPAKKSRRGKRAGGT
jgi:hypothetical protein